MSTSPSARPAPEQIPLHRVPTTSAVRATVDGDHVARLAEVLECCPPILLSEDGTLVDGAHRLEAARLRGWATIPATRTPARSRAQVLLAAARANAAHGLPLGRDERRAAVRELLSLDPSFSDRALAEACGVARSTVAGLREEQGVCSGGVRSHVRRGSDGKRYPATPLGNTGSLADAITRLNPQISVRDLAKRLGVSVGTAHRYRVDALARLRQERWWIRAIHRAVARWRLWHDERKF